MSLPAGWPAPADVEVLPSVWLAMDSEWPPAEGDRPAGTAPVGSWSVERELVGSVLPGNVRARSGLSIGSASASIAQMAVSPLAPWAADPDRRVTTGQTADLYATHGGHDDVARIALGDWQVSPTSGSLLSPGVQVDLIERQYAGREQDQALPMAQRPIEKVTFDPIGIIDILARQAGYYATPPPIASTIASVPLVGGDFTEVPTPTWTASIGDWGEVDGVPCLVADSEPVGGQTIGVSLEDVAPLIWGTVASVYVIANITDTVRFRWLNSVGNEACAVEIRPGGQFAVRNSPALAWVVGNYTPGLDPNWPNRVEINVERVGAPFLALGAESCRARVRSSSTVPFDAFATSNGLSGTMAENMAIVSDATDASVGGVQVNTTTDHAESWAPPTASLRLLGGSVAFPWLPATTDAWTGIQEVCAAWCASANVTRDKVLQVLDSDALAGVGRTAVELDVGRHVEDLGWTLDPADIADRLEVTYSPPSVIARDFADPDAQPPVVWQASEVIRIEAGETREIIADLDVYAGAHPGSTSYRWVRSSESAAIRAQGSLWDAYTNPDGSGAPVVSAAVQLSTRYVSTGRAVITVRNALGLPVYFVDAAGSPCLILREEVVVRFDNQALVTRGATTEVARSPLAIDLGRHVQTAADAEAIADYVWARVSTPMWKASSVRVKLDWTLDIGDVRHLTHERSGLDIKALVTKVAFDGGPGEVAQSLDLVLLPPTWADFDAAWVAGTWDDFDAAWAGKTWNDFDYDPLSTEA